MPKIQRVRKSTSRPLKGRAIKAEEFERMVAAVPAGAGARIPVFQVGPLGLEPRTNGLKVRCSTD